MICFRSLVISALGLAMLSARAASAQRAAPPQPPAGSNWSHVKAVAHGEKVHITTDHHSITCRVFSVTDDAILCEDRTRRAGRVVPRMEIERVKLAHYQRSALLGAGLGAGAGAVSGGVIGYKASCHSGAATCFPAIATGLVAAVFGLGGAAVGAAVGGPTDFARGSSIYVRP